MDMYIASAYYCSTLQAAAAEEDSDDSEEVSCSAYKQALIEYWTAAIESFSTVPAKWLPHANLSSELLMQRVKQAMQHTRSEVIVPLHW